MEVIELCQTNKQISNQSITMTVNSGEPSTSADGINKISLGNKKTG